MNNVTWLYPPPPPRPRKDVVEVLRAVIAFSVLFSGLAINLSLPVIAGWWAFANVALR